jgi:transcriptional regulator with XRE-family HTH domain
MNEGRVVKEMEAIIDSLFSSMAENEQQTWKDVAEVAGLSYTTVTRLRDNITRLPSMLTICKLCRVVGVELTLTQKKMLKVYKGKVG